MRDVLPRSCGWCEAGEPFGLATVVSTFSSAPRPPGAAMAVHGERGGRQRVRRLRRGRGVRAGART